MNLAMIARKVGIPSSKIYHIVNGCHGASPELAARLEKATNIKKEAWISPDEFLLKKQVRGANDPPQLKKWRY